MNCKNCGKPRDYHQIVGSFCHPWVSDTFEPLETPTDPLADAKQLAKDNWQRYAKEFDRNKELQDENDYLRKTSRHQLAELDQVHDAHNVETRHSKRLRDQIKGLNAQLHAIHTAYQGAAQQAQLAQNFKQALRKLLDS